MKRILSAILVLATLISLFSVPASAANTPGEALGDLNIFSGGYPMEYLAVNGKVQKQEYTYFLDDSPSGVTKEIPAYCVNPSQFGVPQTVGPGESIKYLAEEAASDPKIVGLVANMYPHRSLAELKLENLHQAFYAGKIALWCYLIPGWDISKVTVNPSLSGLERERAEKILAATIDIYNRGMAWTSAPKPKLDTTADRATAYPVTVDGKQYKQQIFTVTSDTWVCDYKVNIAFSNPDDVPSGTRIVDMSNKDITTLIVAPNGGSYNGKFKVLFPTESVEGQSGSVQFSLNAEVYQYAVFYALCQETDKYGNLQSYLADTDPQTVLQRSAVSTFDAPATPPDVDTPDTGLEILKLEEGTDTPLAGAAFEVKDPEGKTIGTYTTGYDGKITIPLVVVGNYTVTEVTPPKYHLLSDHPTQSVTVKYGEIAKVSFHNAPYGELRIEKIDEANGAGLPGAVLQFKNIKTGVTQSVTTMAAGIAQISELAPGSYEVRELAAPMGYIKSDEVKTVEVRPGQVSSVTFKNQSRPGLRITKYDAATMTTLPGTTFKIYRDAALYGTYTTDALGEIVLRGIEPGTYLVQEVAAPGSHVVNSTPQQIEVKAGSTNLVELVFFNELKPGISLIKVNSEDMRLLPNAKFLIQKVGDSFSKEYTTGADGRIDLSELTPGSYTVKEITAPDGYLMDDATRTIQLNPGENAQFIFTNTIKPSLSLIKLSADGTPLSGVTFRIAKIEDGSHYLDRTTDAQGKILIEGLAPGVYSVKETATREDHLLDLTEHHVELFPGQTSTIVLNNNRRPALTIHKSDADTGAPVPDTVYTVKAVDGSTVTEVKTGPDGTVKLENLLPIVYEVIEKSVPSPYLLDAPPQLITLHPNRDSDIYFENHKAPTIEIIKENSITHELLANVPFRVWYASNQTSTGELNDLGVFTTDENGRIALTGPDNGLKDGWFRVKELEPPWGFSIKDSDTQEAFVAAGKSHTFRFENTPLSAIVVWKYDSKHGQALANCRFQLRYLGGETSGSGGTIVGTYVTAQNGSFTVTGLKAGYYICEELASDGGHVIDTAPQTVYISGRDQDVVQLYFGNSPKGALLIKKSDSAFYTPLSDTEFMVTTSDGTAVGNANGKFVTDSAGSILIENIDPGTTLVVKEIRPKDGYLLDNTPQTVKIKAGETVTLEFRNQPTTTLVLQKYIEGSKNIPIPGVEFLIADSSGAAVGPNNGKYTTDANGRIVIPGLTPGTTITAKETKTAEGFVLDGAPQSIQIKAGEVQTLTFWNKRVGGLELIKINEADKTQRIPNVSFEIRRMNDALVDTVTTGKNGRVYIPLEAGNYYAVEIKAAEGFKLDDTPQYFTVKDSETTTLTVTNKAFSGILLHKIDSTTRKGIYGVPFLLYDEKMNPVTQFVTDQNGYAYIDTLELSGKVHLRELKNDGYILDDQLKTVYVRPGETTEITWENTPIMGQIQLIKKSADDNPISGLPAGSLLEGARFEISDKAGNVVDTIVSDRNGLASSKLLPLGRYTVREVQAPAYYSATDTAATVYLEFSGQIVRLETTNKSVNTGVSITKTGPREAMSGQPVRYLFSGIANTSTVPLGSFYVRDYLPTAVRLDKVVTGSYNKLLNYKIVYRVNGGEYRTLADSLSTSKTYTFDASPAALGLASNERVTEIMFVFGQVSAGFAQVEAPALYCTAVPGLVGGTSFTNTAEAGGVYNGQWIQAVTRWVTTVYGKPVPLPRTGY